MNWKPVTVAELTVGQPVRHGAAVAEVVGWRWRVDLDQAVVDVRYLEPESYAGQCSQWPLAAGGTIEAWQAELPEGGGDVDDAPAEGV